MELEESGRSKIYMGHFFSQNEGNALPARRITNISHSIYSMFSELFSNILWLLPALLLGSAFV